MKRIAGIVCALIALRADAGTLDEVRAAVNRLSAKQPVRATFSTESFVKTAGRFANDDATRIASAEVVHDAAGVSITIPQALLDKASRDTAGQQAIGSLRSITIVEALDFRDPLLRMLENATVAEEKRVAFRGRPARLIVLKLTSRPEREGGTIRIGSVKSDDQMSLWVGDDDLPLAADRVQKTTAGFMVFRASFAGRTNYTFAHTSDRLILARVETSDSGSGMGQKVARTSVQTLTLH